MYQNVIRLTAFAVLITPLAMADQPVDAIVASLQEKSPTPHIEVAIATRDGLCFARVYGNATPAEPIRMHAASISKLFTAVAVMQLVEEGKLSQTDAIGKHVAEFAASKITIEQLLTHTSGLRDRQRADGRVDTREIDSYFTALARQRLADTKWQYADANFNLLGRVIERLRNASYPEFMRGRMLMPLGMQHSDFELSRVSSTARAASYEGNRKQSHPWDAAFVASAGLQTTAIDLAKFATAVLAIEAARPGLIERSSLHAMTTPRLPTEWPGVMQGYGWQLADTEIGKQWRHAGGERGFESLLALYPERGFAVIVMGNREDWPRFPLELKLRTLMASRSLPCLN